MRLFTSVITDMFFITCTPQFNPICIETYKLYALLMIHSHINSFHTLNLMNHSHIKYDEAIFNIYVLLTE